MTQSLEYALFDLDSGGRMVLPADLQHSDPEAIEALADDWTAKLSPMDRAYFAVVPDSVSVTDRAGHLMHSLKAISEANSRNGFVHATGSAQYRPAIEERYGPHTDGMAEGAGYNALTGERRARYEFFAASGLGRLALTNRLPVAAEDAETADPEDLVYQSFNRLWREFHAKYGGTGHQVRARRNAYRKLLAEQVQYTSEGS
ncbi:MAG TPA: hypothetical protein VFT16_05625 [Candidatus Saccharimonadales bacterium]|nr:hypothetical protein [Candidatus Saccharimonadales bacterium]